MKLMSETQIKPLRDDIRARARAKRSAMGVRARMMGSSAVIRELAEFLPKGVTVACYASFAGEVNIDGLADLRDDLTLAWPISQPDKLGMDFRMTKQAPTDKGTYGIREPEGGNAVDASDFDIMLIPGLAFSAGGARIGMGLGYYDRYLANVRDDALRIGICYDWQIYDELPEAPHDIRMTHLATTTGVVNCGKG